MSFEKFCDGPGGSVFFYSDQLRIDRPHGEGATTMAEKKSGPFSPAPERPLNDWLNREAGRLAKEENLSFAQALSQAKLRNPQIAKAADLEVRGVPEGGSGKNYLEIMRRALAIQKATGLPTEACLARAEVADPDLAMAARKERNGSLYASLTVAPGIGDTQVLMSDGVEAALDPGKHLTMLAEERSRRDGVSFGEALVSVARARPELARASRERALGRRLY